MKIEYKILWLDDQIRQFIDDEIVDELNAFLEEKGFRPTIVTAENSDEFFNELNDSYDLILTDYHMSGMQGDQVVDRIRSSDYSILTEILFYTAKADLAAENKIDRVTFLETSSKSGTHQEVVLDETKKLISITVKKFQHIVAMRGMIMHETSSLDSKMLSILRSYIGNNENSAAVETIADDVLADAENVFSEKLNKIKKWRQNKNLNKASKDNFVFSAKFKIKTMGQILTLLGEEDFSEDYDESINKIRNKFAHAILETDNETGREYFQGDEMTFDESLCHQIRVKIRTHDQNLDNLSKKVGS